MSHSIGYLLVMSLLVLQQGRKENAHTKAEVWKLREPSVKQEFARLVTDRKDEVFEADNVESKWNGMKEVWQKATEQVCGWTKGLPRHSETWWWNDEVVKAIEEKKKML